MKALQTDTADKAATFDHMLEVARAAGFGSITEAIVVASKAREAAQEPAADWQVRRVGNPSGPSPWLRAMEPKYAKQVYETCPNHIDGNGWEYRPLYPHPPAAQSAGQEAVALTDQQIYDQFQFLEGLVSEQQYRKIAETAIKIVRAAPVNVGERDAELEREHFGDPDKRTGIYAERAEDAQQVGRELPASNFISYLIDHCEQETITEERLQHWYAAALANPQYAALTSPANVGGDEREAFEAWVAKEWPGLVIDRAPLMGFYKGDDGARLEDMWAAYSAALSTDGGERKDAAIVYAYRALLEEHGAYDDPIDHVVKAVAGLEFAFPHLPKAVAGQAWPAEPPMAEKREDA